MLGVTLAPSQVLSMRASLSAVTVATVDPQIAPVPLPAGGALLLGAMGLLTLRRRSRKRPGKSGSELPKLARSAIAPRGPINANGTLP